MRNGAGQSRAREPARFPSSRGARLQPGLACVASKGERRRGVKREQGKVSACCRRHFVLTLAAVIFLQYAAEELGIILLYNFDNSKTAKQNANPVAAPILSLSWDTMQASFSL
jgi:hypothetical protein